MSQQGNPPPPHSSPPPPPITNPPPSPHQIHFQPCVDSESLPSPQRVKKTASTSSKHPLYRGIRSRSGKWVSEIREPKKTTRIWLGTYPMPEMAAAAYDVAALALKGGDAVLNFPDRVGNHPTPYSLAPQDIRNAAAAAAAANAVASSDGKPVPPLPDSTNDEWLSGDHHHSDEFFDEEALFDLPNLLINMAEGMLVSPPRIMGSPASDESPGNSDAESLWSY